MNGMMHHVSGGNILPEPNFFLGNVANTITTKEICATFFAYYGENENIAISSNDIKNFTINGNDVRFYIDKDIVVVSQSGQGKFSTDTNIEYLIDVYSYLKGYNYRAFQSKGGFKVFSKGSTRLDTQSFRYVGASFYHYFPNVLDINGIYIWQNCTPKRLYLPNCTIYGSSPTTTSNIFNAMGASTIYVHVSMLTINGGGLEADLAYAQNTGGCTIVGILNDTPPSSITNLSYSNLTGSSVDLNFTPPSSTNSLSFYEVWIDDGTSNPRQLYLIHSEITASGATVDLTGITLTGLKIKLAACDIYWNGSGYSDNPSWSNEVILP